MNISTHIINLLQLNEQVVVPGLGTFIVEYNTAKINSADNTFSPPSKKVIFDSFTPDDSMLAEFISKNNSISFDEANLQIKEFVGSILTSIQKNNEYDIIGLGKFIITKESQIAFITFEKNFSDDHFGLPEFVASEIIRNNGKEKAQIITDRDKNKLDKKISFKRKIIKQAVTFSILFLIIGIIFFVFFFTDLFRGNIGDNKGVTDNILQNEKVATQENIPQIDNSNENAKKDTFIPEKQTIKEEHIKVEVKPEKEKVTQKVQRNQENYYLVAGSFKQEENAIKRVNELIAKGYKYAGVTRNNNKGLYIVYYGAYSNRNEAEKQQENIKKTENPETWILKN